MPASVALCEDEVLLAQSFQNSGLTHFRTLMPMAVDLLKNCGLTLDEVDVVAVARRAGLFHRAAHRRGRRQRAGLAGGKALRRLFYSGVHGLAPGSHWRGRSARVMDARRNQVYNGPLSWDGRQPGAPVPRPGRGPGGIWRQS